MKISKDIKKTKFFFNYGLVFFFITFVFLGITGIAGATNYYVAPFGNNSDKGNLDEPWKNLSYATQKVTAGDTIYLINGTWYNEICTFANSGNLTHPITVDTYNGTPTFIGDLNATTSFFMYIKNKEFINIKNITIRDYYYGIEARNSSYININGIYVNHTQGGAVYFRDACYSSLSDSEIYNVTGGGNSVGVVITQYPNSTHHINIINNTIAHNPLHNAIDLFNAAYNDSYYVQDVNIVNNTIYDVDYCAIFTHGASPLVMYRINITDNTVYDCYALHASYLYDSIVSNNKIYNMWTHGITASVPIDNVTFEKNILYGNEAGAEDIYILTDNGSVSLKNNNCSSYRFDGKGNVTIQDPIVLMDALSVKCVSNANVNIKYTDNKLFDIIFKGGSKYYEINGPTYYPSSSYATMKMIGNKSDSTLFKFTIYPMTVEPSSDTVNLTLNKFNTSLPQGDVLVNFTADTVDGNNVVFTVGDLKPYGCYLVKRDGEKLTATKANYSGYIKFNNSQWSKHTFTIEESVSSPSQEPPVSSAGSDKIVYSCSRVCFDGSKSTGDNISYKWDFDASNGIQADATGPIVNYTYENPGIYTVTLTVTDANNNTDSDTCAVTVVEKQVDTKVRIFSPNASLPGKTFTVDLLIDPSTPVSGTQLDFVFDSSMASANSVTEGDFLKQDGIYTIFSRGTINNSAGTVKNIYGFILGTSNASTPGNFATVNLTAGNKTGIAEFSLSNVLISDANSKSVPYTVTNATVLIDTAPVMNPICCPKSVDEKSTISFKVSAKDADGDRLVLSASGLPQGAVFNTTSGNFTWTPERGQAGVYTIAFKVSDGYLTDSQSITLTVNKLNNPPLISSFEPLNGSSFSEGERIGILVNASDANGQTLDYSIRIDGVVYATEKEYVWETDYSSSGNHTIEVVVSDGIDEVKKQHIVSITDCRPRWDVNEDGIVNILDITIVSKNYGAILSKPYPRYDVNQDGEVNIQDLTLVGHYFGEIVK